MSVKAFTTFRQLDNDQGRIQPFENLKFEVPRILSTKESNETLGTERVEPQRWSS